MKKPGINATIAFLRESNRQNAAADVQKIFNEIATAAAEIKDPVLRQRIAGQAAQGLKRAKDL